MSVLKKIDCGFTLFGPLLLMKEKTSTALIFDVDKESLGVGVQFSNCVIHLLASAQEFGTKTGKLLAGGAIVGDEAIRFGDGLGLVARKSFLVEGGEIPAERDSELDVLGFGAESLESRMFTVTWAIDGDSSGTTLIGGGGSRLDSCSG